MSQRICALRLPGTSHARFADAASVRCRPGDWVMVETSVGIEAGLIVVAPDQWTEPVEMPDVPSLLRLTTADEQDQLARNVRRSRDLVSPAADVVRAHSAGCYLTGLRVTLDGSRAVVSYRGIVQDEETLTDELTKMLSLSVVLEAEAVASVEDSLLSGSTGDVDRSTPETFRELLESRLDVLRDPSTVAPQGIPRLNSQVQTSAGRGRLLAVDIRHWNATVELADGEEVTVGVDELSVV